MAGKEQRKSAENGELEGQGFFVIFPVILPKVIVVDFRQSLESFPAVVSFSLRELLESKFVRQLSEDIRQAGDINFLSVVEVLREYSTIEDFSSKLIRIIGVELNKIRPDAEPLNSAVIFGFDSSLEEVLDSESWGKMRQFVLEKGGQQILSELEDVMSQLETEERKTLQTLKTGTLQDVIKGDGYETLWQRPQTN